MEDRHRSNWLRRALGPHCLPQLMGATFWVAIGLAFLVLGAEIRMPSFASNQKDPGPRLFPFLLASLMILGGLAQAFLTVRSSILPKQTPSSSGSSEVPFSWKTLCGFGLGLGLYLWAIPWIGFEIASFVFALAMMTRLGTHWFRSLWIVFFMVLGIHVVFGRLLKVILPEAALW